MISVVITAAGNSTRFGENKLLSDLAGRPMIVRTVEQFAKCSQVDEIIVATRRQDIAFYQDIFARYHLHVKVVEGGNERIESVYNGTQASNGTIILTHDGARPLTPLWLIENLIKAVEEHGAAMTAVPPTATVKYAEDDLIIQKSLPRTTTWIAQTPQGFRRDILLGSLESAIQKKYFVATDDSEIIAAHGHKVKIVPGDPVNIKVTFRSDLSITNELFIQDKPEQVETLIFESQEV
ncbi:MAG: 2-C-methyl-D-erythritol 4-phosphate cytidylyltransferase [Simkania sp.]|nr:2-C-methyl-D-erythritol 4-phosphate cytidylyltransferase [Simkania sp.]